MKTRHKNMAEKVITGYWGSDPIYREKTPEEKLLDAIPTEKHDGAKILMTTYKIVNNLE